MCSFILLLSPELYFCRFAAASLQFGAFLGPSTMYCHAHARIIYMARAGSVSVHVMTAMAHVLRIRICTLIITECGTSFRTEQETTSGTDVAQKSRNSTRDERRWANSARQKEWIHIQYTYTTRNEIATSHRSGDTAKLRRCYRRSVFFVRHCWHGGIRRMSKMWRGIAEWWNGLAEIYSSLIVCFE